MTSSTRSFRDIIYRVAAEYNGDNKNPILGTVGYHHNSSDKMSILSLLRIVEEAVLGGSQENRHESTPMLVRVKFLAELFDIDLVNYDHLVRPNIFDRLEAGAEHVSQYLPEAKKSKLAADQAGQDSLSTQELVNGNLPPSALLSWTQYCELESESSSDEDEDEIQIWVDEDEIK